MEDSAMTKKTYMQPTILAVKIQTAGMIAFSNVKGFPGGYDDNGADPNDAG